MQQVFVLNPAIFRDVRIEILRARTSSDSTVPTVVKINSFSNRKIFNDLIFDRRRPLFHVIFYDWQSKNSYKKHNHCQFSYDVFFMLQNRFFVSRKLTFFYSRNLHAFKVKILSIITTRFIIVVFISLKNPSFHFLFALKTKVFSLDYRLVPKVVRAQRNYKSNCFLVYHTFNDLISFIRDPIREFRTRELRTSQITI